MSPTEGWIERDGVRLRYLDWAPAEPVAGPDLLLLHGLSSNALVWTRIVERMPGRRIVALDQRGHGRSDRPEGGYGAAGVIADAVQLMAELGLDRPVVAGQSWGAGVALALAAAHPELLSGLALVDGGFGSLRPRMTWEEASARMGGDPPTYADLEEAAAAQAAYLGDAWGADLVPFVAAGLAPRADGRLSTISGAALLECVRFLYDANPAAELEAASGPVLVCVAGRTWPGAPPEVAAWKRASADAAAQARPDAWVHWYDSAHDIQLHMPDRLAADLERLLLAGGLERARARLARLAGDWTRPVRAAEPAWTARQTLAHVASSQTAIAAAIGAGAAGRDPGRPAFDPDRWNRSQVARREQATPAELKREAGSATEDAIARLEDADLGAPTVIGPLAGAPLRELLLYMTRHQEGHVAEIGAALA